MAKPFENCFPRKTRTGRKAMKLNREQIQTLVQRVVDTRTEELDCDVMMRVLTAYADKLASGDEVGVTDDETVQHHLAVCPECREEFEMIKGIAEEGNLREEERL